MDIIIAAIIAIVGLAFAVTFGLGVWTFVVAISLFRRSHQEPEVRR